MTMGEDNEVLMCKPEVFVYNIAPSIQRKTGYLHRASDWNIESPDWHGKIQLLASGPSCIIHLEDKRGDIFAKGLIQSFPGDDLKAVLDSTRYFTVRLQTCSGENELFGIGFTSRCDSGDLKRALKDHFESSARKKRASENGNGEILNSDPPPIKRTKTEEIKLESKPEKDIKEASVVQNNTLSNSKSVLKAPAQQKVVASPVQQKVVTVEQQQKVVTASPVQKVATAEQQKKVVAATPAQKVATTTGQQQQKATTPFKSKVDSPAQQQQKASPVKTKVATLQPQKVIPLKTISAATATAITKSANVSPTKAAKPNTTVSPQDTDKASPVKPTASPTKPAIASDTCKASEPPSTPTVPPPLSTTPQLQRRKPPLRSILKNTQSSSSPLITVNPAPELPTAIVKVASTVINGSPNGAASLVSYDSERTSPIPTELVAYAIEAEESLKQDGGSTTTQISDTVKAPEENEASNVNSVDEKSATVDAKISSPNKDTKSPALNPTVSLLRMPVSSPTQLTSPGKGKSIFIVKTSNNVITPGATTKTQPTSSPSTTTKVAAVPNPLFKAAVETEAATEPVVKSNKAPIANLSRAGASKPLLIPTPVSVELAAPPITQQSLQVTRQSQEDIELIDLDSDGENSKDVEGEENVEGDGEENAEGDGEDKETTEETELQQESTEVGEGVEGEGEGGEDFCDAEAGEEGEEAIEEFFDDAAVVEGDDVVVESEMMEVEVAAEEVVEEEEIGIDHVEDEEEVQTEEKQTEDEFIGVDPTDEDYFREQISLEGEQETNLDDIDTSELIVPETGEELDPAAVVVELNGNI